MQNFRNLFVWQKAHQLTLDVYQVTRNFPNHELYGLTSQLRRSSSSIPTNLAEGAGKLTNLDFRRYVSIAFGSANELEYLLFLAYCLNYLEEETYIKLDSQCKEIKKMLSGLIDKLGKRIIGTFFCISILVCGVFLIFS